MRERKNSLEEGGFLLGMCSEGGLEGIPEECVEESVEELLLREKWL